MKYQMTLALIAAIAAGAMMIAPAGAEGIEIPASSATGTSPEANGLAAAGGADKGETDTRETSEDDSLIYSSSASGSM